MPSDARTIGSHSVATNQSPKLLNIRVDDISPDRLINEIADAVSHRRRLSVVNANAHLVNLAQRRPWLIELFNGAGIAFCDGAGVQFGVWLQTGCKPSRHTPPQWIDALARRLAADGASVYWLGGRPQVVQAAAERLQSKTGLRAAGFHHGFFDTTPGCAENEAVLADIRTARPDLLLINMGMPIQERWLFDNWDRLDTPVAITAGALVDHMAGIARRPPAWVANAGIEWLVRLAIEPRRLWRRYVIGLPVFGMRLLANWGRDPLAAWRARSILARQG
jgi:N-acetylglucosaminyldiphosphoundecaprenol N-acetyl-beta-D-mannosaminyltransferase